MPCGPAAYRPGCIAEAEVGLAHREVARATTGQFAPAGGTRSADLQFTGPAKHDSARLGTKPESQSLEIVDQQRHRRDQPALLGVQQDAKCAGQPDAKDLGMLPCQGIVQDHHWIGRFQSKQQHLRLAGSKIRDQTHDLAARWGAHVDPRQGLRCRHIDTLTSTFRQFVDNSGRNDDRLDQFRQQVKLTDLVQILEWRRVADDFRQGRFDAPGRAP